MCSQTVLQYLLSVIFLIYCILYVSPLRELNIDSLPAPNLDNLSSESNETGSSRRHQRSMSSEEASEALLDTIAAQQQSAR